MLHHIILGVSLFQFEFLSFVVYCQIPERWDFFFFNSRVFALGEYYLILLISNLQKATTIKSNCCCKIPHSF